jgi:hypothetical protein
VLILQPSDLVAGGDKVFGQLLEAAVVCHILFDLGRLVLGDALRELLAVAETLEDKIGATGGGGAGRVRFEELFAQRAAAEPVNGLHLVDEGLSFLEESIEIWFHGVNVSVWIQYATTK